MPDTEPQLTEGEVEDLLRVAGNGSLQFPLRVEGWHKSLSDGGWFIRQSSGRIVMTVAFVPAETESGIPAREGNAPARTAVALLNSVPALIRDWRALRKEITVLRDDLKYRCDALQELRRCRDRWLTMLNPAAADETVDGAIRNLQQAYTTERDNAAEFERENAALRKQLAQATYERDMAIRDAAVARGKL